MQLDAFRPGQLQDFITCLELLAQGGITDIQEVITLLRQRIGCVVLPDKGRVVPAIDAIACRQCGGSVSINPVNVSRCSRIGGPWRSAVECRNPACLHIEYRVEKSHALMTRRKK